MSRPVVWRADMPDMLLRQALLPRRRANWPVTYEATMADPVLAAVVRIQAGLMSRRLVPLPREPHYGTAHTARTSSVRPTFDRKRAAAGEREED